MQRVLNQEEIDAIVQAARGQTSGVSKSEKSVQACDFRQAGQLSRELAQAISGMYEGFARNVSQALGIYLPVPVQALLVSVEQLTYKDFLVRTPEITYIVSELHTGFQIGAVLFLPFLVIDMVVASVTTSIGMMQLPPVVISTPLKLLLFVMVDGWNLVIGSLMRSFS
jgi:type III secretory pathway component EscR